jgi:hypothetical protein
MCAGSCVDTSSDVGNCGACGQACTTIAPSTVQCEYGHCVTTLASGQEASDLAVDATAVYWANTNSVATVPLGGGTPSTFAQNQLNATGIALDANDIYIADPAPPGAIYKMPLAGSSFVTLAAAPSDPWSIAIHGTSAFWLAGGSLVTVPVAGGTPTTLASSTGASNDGVNMLALDSVNVYWIDFGPGLVLQRPLAGGSTTTLASGRTNPVSLTVSGTNVYWSENYQQGQVLSVPVGGGQITTLLSGAIGPLASDASSLYYPMSGVLMKQPLGGGAPTSLASTPVSTPVNAMVVDGTSVYWAAQSVVAKVTPK